MDVYYGCFALTITDNTMDIFALTENFTLERGGGEVALVTITRCPA